jgi:hypothetical protein
MTRNRKTQVILLALVPLMLLAAASCADAPSAPQPRSTAASANGPSVTATLAKLHTENDWIGQAHNDALAYVLAALKRLPAKADHHAVCETAIAAYREFHRTRFHAAVPREVDNAAEASCSASKGFALAGAAFSLVPNGVRRTELSPEGQDYLNQMDAAIDAANSDADLTTAVSNIEYQAAANLSYDEAAGIVMAGEVTLSSASYWEGSYTDWLPYVGTLLDYNRVSASAIAPGGPRFDFWGDFKSAGRRAIKGDFQAAVAAVVREWFLSATIGFDFVVGSAAVGSVMAVLQQ